MKTSFRTARFPHAVTRTVLATSIVALLAAGSSHAATLTWDGGGGNPSLSNPLNWVGDIPPVANDSLIFDGFARLGPNNDFASGTAFNGLTFAATAGGFSLGGNQITLHGDIVDNSVGLTQTITLPLALDASRNANVVFGGSLTLSGNITGSTFGLTKTGTGLLTLGGTNTFSGPLTVNAGVVSATSDTQLGAVPASATAARLVLNNGTLRSGSGAGTSFTIDSKRGIAVGPTSGTGDGTIQVVQNGRFNVGAYTSGAYTGATTVTYGGVIANNGGGTGGLIKNGFGGLVLSGQNTYTGATKVTVGTLRLDFSAATAPINNIISPLSALTLGGENSGLGGQSFAALVMTGKGGVTNTQAFSSTRIDLGTTYVRANSGAAGSVSLDLGALSHNVGGVVTAILPSAGTGNIRTSSTNDNGTLGAASGIIGGWATISTTGAPIQNNTIIPSQTLAAVDAIGNIVPYTGYTAYNQSDDTAGTTLESPTFANKNLLIGGGTAHAPISVKVALVPGDVGYVGPTLVDVNTISTINASADQEKIFIGAGNTLRLGKFGALFRQHDGASFGSIVGGTVDVANGTLTAAHGVGTLTAGGAPDTAGEIVLHVSHQSQTTGRMIVAAKITDNGTGPVSVIKTGPGGLKINAHNTYSGGTFVIQGLIQLTGTENGHGTAGGNPDGLGTGPVYIFPGGRVSLATGTQTNDYYIAGIGTDQENFGALIAQTDSILTGKLTLIGDARVGRGAGTGHFLQGQITDNGAGFTLNFGDGGTTAPVTLRNLTATPNDWTGTTLIGRGVLHLGADNQIPDGVGKANVVLNSDAGGNPSTFNLGGFSETINGLSTAGDAAMTNLFVENQAASTTSLLTLGNNNQTASFRGFLRDAAGTLALTKIGLGIQTLSAANTYTGATTINGGTLSVTGSLVNVGQAGPIDGLVNVNSGGTLSGTGDGLATGRVGNVTLAPNGVIAPGATSGLADIGSLSMAALTVNGGDLQFDLTTLATANDRITVSGAATFSASSTITVGIPSQSNVTYPLLSAGTLTLTVPPILNAPANTRLSYALDLATANQINLAVSGNVGNLNWSGATNGAWDVVGTSNWLQGAATEKFFNGDAVNFPDGPTNRNISISTLVLPGSVTVNNSTGNDYVIGGPGAIGGATGLSKVNSGQVTLTSNNSYSGTTTIDGGIMQIGNGGSSGTLGAGLVTNNAILAFNRNDSSTISNVIGGTGELRQLGTGVSILSGASTYTGATTISVGTIQVTNADPINFVSSLGALPGGPTTPGAVNVSSGGTLDLGGGAAANNMNFGGKQFNIAGTGVNGNGVIVNSGLAQQNALQLVSLTADATIGGNGRFDIRGAGSQLSLGGNTLTKKGFGQFSLVDTTVTDGNILVTEGTLSIETTTSILAGAGNITFNAGTTAQFFQLTGALTRSLIFKGITATNGNQANGYTVASNITLDGDNTFDIGNATGSLTFSGNLVETGGARSLTKTGVGTLILTGTNIWTGATIIGGGTLQIGDGTTTGSLLQGTNNVTDNGFLAFNRSDDITDTHAISGTGGVKQLGAGMLTLSGNNSYSGATIVENGTLKVGTATSLPSGTAVTLGSATTFTNGILDLAGFNATVGGLTSSSAGGSILSSSSTTTDSLVTFTTGTTEFGGILQNGINGGTRTLSLTVASGSLTLSGNNIYTGATTINPGATLQLGNNSASGTLGTAATVTNNGTLAFNRFDDITIDKVISGTGGVQQLGFGKLTLTTLNPYSGPTRIANGVLSVGTLADGGLASNIGISSSAAFNLVLNGGTLQYTGPGTSTDRLFTLGSLGGTLDASGAPGALNFTNTGTLAFEGNAAGGRTLNLGGAGLANLAAALIDNGAEITSLTKLGTSIWMLGGANTYTGQTTVTGGNLVVNGSLNGTNSLVVQTSANLGGNGSITTGNGGTVSLGAGSTLTPGALSSPGTLTMNLGAGFLDLSSAANGTGSLLWDIGASSDHIALNTGTLSIGTGVFDLDDFVFNNVGGFGLGTYVLINSDSSIFGSLGSNVSGNLFGFPVNLELADSSKDLVLVVVPEPSAAAAILGGMAVLIGCGRRRRR